MMTQPSTVGLIGFGRFGKTLAELLHPHLQLKIFDPTPTKNNLPIEFCPLEEVVKVENIIVAVPIRAFKNLIKKIAPLLNPKTTIMDVCSVKQYPNNMMLEELPESVGIIATHPMFGPDSIAHAPALKMVMHNTRDSHGMYTPWKTIFTDLGLRIIELSPEEHDRQAAVSQGVAHYIGRILELAGINATQIDTEGFKSLLKLLDITSHDSWELFCDLQNYNAYTPAMRQQLEKAMTEVNRRLLQSQELRRENETPDQKI